MSLEIEQTEQPIDPSLRDLKQSFNDCFKKEEEQEYFKRQPLWLIAILLFGIWKELKK